MLLTLRSSFRMSSVLAATAMIGSAAFAEHTTPETVEIEGVAYEGSGCPEGSVGSYISEDKEVMTLSFDQFSVASDGPAMPRTLKQCNLHVHLHAAPGWSYAVFAIEHRGYARIDKGISAELKTAARFGDTQSLRDLGASTFQGPLVSDYLKSSEIVLAEAQWSPCSAGSSDDHLNIFTTATVARTGDSLVQNLVLSSRAARYAEQNLEKPVTAMKLVRQDSAAACVLNRSFGFTDTRVWTNFGCRGEFAVTVLNEPTPDSSGALLTVDTIDGQAYSKFHLAWRKCDVGQWIQSDGKKTCDQVCKLSGKRVGKEELSGAQCASGESRPNGAIAAGIQFPLGCWGGCSAMGEIASAPIGLFCFAPGQKRDFDRTDRIAACYCQ